MRGRWSPAAAHAAMLLVLFAPAARPSPGPIPSAANSIVPSSIMLVGRDGQGVPDPRGSFYVEVRNFFNVPIPGSLVILSFPNCTAVHIASTGYPAGVTVDCRPTHLTVRRITDANGRAAFVIPGGGVPGGTQSLKCMVVSADGINLGTASVCTADLDGTIGVGAFDLTLLLSAFAAADPTLGDLDGSGAIGANDLSLWLQVFASGTEVTSAAPACP